MRKRTKSTPGQRAAKYLKRIAALTGARQVDGGGYLLTVGRKHFLVDYNFIYMLSNPVKSTCFSVAGILGMPEDEVVASALLQLKNNPRLSTEWRKRRRVPFKADGKVFRSPSWNPFLN